MTRLLCPNGHNHYAQHPIGKPSSVTDCPFCLIKNIETQMKTLKKWCKQVNKEWKL